MVSSTNIIPTSAEMVAAAKEHVQQELLRRGVDASHDWTHIERVSSLSDRLLRACQLDAPDWLHNTVALCATLHDMADWKYCDSEKAGIAAVKTFLASQDIPAAVCHAVEYVLLHIGFKESLARKSGQSSASKLNIAADRNNDDRANLDSERAAADPVEQRSAACATENSSAQPTCTSGPPGAGQSPFLAGSPPSTEDLVLRIVQDADRLDALGAIGIARCLTFGGRFNRALYDPAVAPRTGLTKEQYTSAEAAAKATTLNHFHEKLFLLQGLMNTRPGLSLAQARTLKMRQFLHDFEEEWGAEDLSLPVPSA